MFRLYQTDDGHQPPVEQLPFSAIQPKFGQALYLTSGKAALATGTNAATHVCVEERDAAVTAGTMINCVKITPDQVWEAPLAAAGALTIGAAYQVSSGVSVSSTTTSGCFVVEYAEGAAAGDAIRGRFNS